jgi:predicted nucleic acid-binding protein
MVYLQIGGMKHCGFKMSKQPEQIQIPDAIVVSPAHYLNLPLITADKALIKVKNIDLILFEPE